MKSGNPVCYYNGTRWDMEWSDGRRLALASNENSTIFYTYDLNGIRTSKTVNGVKHEYTYASGRLLRETYGNVVLDFAYDASGNPFSLTYKAGSASAVTYYYVTNLQGDVMYLVNSSGTRVASYTYDPYGKVDTATGSMAAINPLRYRGYYYDTETGFYYVSSRYYDPEIARWINADSVLAGAAIFLQGYNMFAYCFNNPVNMVDSTGNWPILIKLDPNDIEDFFETVQELILGISISFATDHELNRRPFRGEPGSVFVAPNGDKRGYGADGLPEWDYDHDDHGEKNKPRDENGGHFHDWDHTKEDPRGDAYAISGIGIIGGIILFLESLLMYSVY